MSQKTAGMDLLGKFLFLQYELFLYNIFEQIENRLKNGKSFEEIKEEFEYYPGCEKFQEKRNSRTDVCAFFNEVIINILKLGELEKYIRISADNIEIDEDGIKKDLEKKNKCQPSKFILL